MSRITSILAASLFFSAVGYAQSRQPVAAPGGDASSPAPLTHPPGTGPNLSPRVTQAEILAMSELSIRRAGLRIFSTPFNHFDGFGDGPLDPFDPTSPGGRPTLADNGTFMRINGIDSQTCLECHFVLNNRDVPATFAVGGIGGIGATAMPGPTEIDIDDEDGNGHAAYNGRLVNPPFIWGAGGVELVGKEMTADLQALKLVAIASPNSPVALITKGVDFGTITYDDENDIFDTSDVTGVSTHPLPGTEYPDLVVRPFGRKGNNSSIRKFDTGALAFHHGMQPEEITDDTDGDGIPDVDIDADGDGVFDEILVGELSALHIFTVLSKRPRFKKGNHDQVESGRAIFSFEIGCADCHVPELGTTTEHLDIAFPEVETDPSANVFRSVRLRGAPAAFRPNREGGISVPMYSDLRLHDMGPGLAEKTGAPDAALFITPRLWGIADTAPYLHDGRALTITEAIALHGGEGEAAAAAFDLLSVNDKIDLLAFLDTFRAPLNPNIDLGQ